MIKGQESPPGKWSHHPTHPWHTPPVRILRGEGGGGWRIVDCVFEVSSVYLYYLNDCTVFQVIKYTDVAILVQSFRYLSVLMLQSSQKQSHCSRQDCHRNDGLLHVHTIPPENPCQSNCQSFADGFVHFLLVGRRRWRRRQRRRWRRWRWRWWP